MGRSAPAEPISGPMVRAALSSGLAVLEHKAVLDHLSLQLSILGEDLQQAGPWALTHHVALT